VRPLSMAKRLPRDSVFTGWPGEAWSPTGTCLDQARCFPLRACGARPSAEWTIPARMALRGRARKSRERRFSRRDALCASASQGPTNAKAFRFYPLMTQEAGWPTGHMPRSSRCLPIRACRARPSARWPSDGDKAFRAQTWRWRERRFSRRDALCASAWQGPTNAEAFHFHPTMRPEACGLPGTCLGQADAFLSGRAEPAPPRGGQAKARRPYGSKPGDGV
jgi:hypothetical protein